MDLNTGVWTVLTGTTVSNASSHRIVPIQDTNSLLIQPSSRCYSFHSVGAAPG